MKKSYIYVFTASCIAILIMLIGIIAYDAKHDTRQYYTSDDIYEWTDYEIIGHTEYTCRIGGRINVPSSGYMLAFYSVHQNLEIYENDELIYQYPVENSNPLSISPGYAWNFVPLKEGSAAISMVFSSPYSGYAGKIPVFLTGTPFAIFTHIINSNLFSVLICFVIFVVGLCMIVYWSVVRRKAKIQKNLLKLGIFAILLSVWSINENRLFVLIMRNNIVCSYLSFLSLMLLPFALASFVYSFYESESRLWNIFFTGDLAQIVMCILLQMFDIIDLRSTLWTTHAMMAILAALIIYCSVNQLRDGIHSRRVLLNILCMMVCVIALFLDLIAFYQGAWNSNSILRLGFLCYVILLGLASARESAQLMEKGREAGAYQLLAYTDQMTGLLNRAAFNRDFQDYNNAPDNVGVIDFDLNNLKKTNDTYGHTAGDKYITDASHMINEIFANIGKCYRIGGDEFAVLLKNASNVDLRHYLTMLEWSVDAYNRNEGEKFRMQIAYGCAIYSPENDSSLETTFNRADAAMYHDKKSKKGISH